MCQIYKIYLTKDDHYLNRKHISFVFIVSLRSMLVNSVNDYITYS